MTERRRFALHGVALIAATALVLLAVLSVLSRSFSVRCVEEETCLTLEDLADGAPIPEAAHLYDRNGDPLADVAGPQRRVLPLERIPELVADAYVAIEDRRYWEHDGVDLAGVVRAALANVAAGGIEEGASTIPMQLVRTLWAEDLHDAGQWRRKIVEVRTAPRLVEALGKERVLGLYLNAIYLGDGVYGIEEASRHYFGVPAESMNAAQIATLVAMTRAPERYHPRRSPERTRARRDVVLDVLAELDVLDRAQADSARALPLETVEAPTSIRGRSYATSAVMREIRSVAPHLAGRAGLRVFTTLDTAVQRAAEEALVSRLEAIEEGLHGSFTASEEKARLQGAAVALDARTGAVRAWVGGRDFAESEFDRVAQARRQVGSLVKPFLVALAHERGVGILDLVSSDTLSLEVEEGVWSPADHVQLTRLPIREAMVRSSNRAAVHLGQWLGSDAVRTVGRKVGLDGPIPAVPATFLGAFEASLLEMTRAFSVFGNRGLLVEPHLVERIEDGSGRPLWVRLGPERGPERALGEVTSYVVLDGLRDVVNRGTGYPARRSGYWGEAAGKTGTTDEGRDVWFVGLTPSLVAGVWLGFDQPRAITRSASGSVMAASTWGDWMDRLEERELLGDGRWQAPEGVERVRYDPANGRVYPASCEEGDLPSAAVVAGLYAPGRCPSGLTRWFDAIWRRIRPPEVRELPTVEGRRGGR